MENSAEFASCNTFNGSFYCSDWNKNYFYIFYSRSHLVTRLRRFPFDSDFYYCGFRLMCQNKCFYIAARPRIPTSSQSRIMAASNVHYVVENEENSLFSLFLLAFITSCSFVALFRMRMRMQMSHYVNAGNNNQFLPPTFKPILVESVSGESWKSARSRLLFLVFHFRAV